MIVVVIVDDDDFIQYLLLYFIQLFNCYTKKTKNKTTIKTIKISSGRKYMLQSTTARIKLTPKTSITTTTTTTDVPK